MIKNCNLLRLNDETEISLLEFLFSHGREFVKSFFIRFVSFSIVSVNFGFVYQENFFSVGVFNDRLKTDFMFVFPELKFREFLFNLI